MYRTAIPFLIIFFAVSCVSIAPVANPGSDIKPDTVIIVGRVSFQPEPEQKLASACIGCGNLKRKAFVTLHPDKNMMLSDDLVQVSTGESLLKAKPLIEAKWGEPFIAEIPRKPIYLKGLMVNLIATGYRSQYLMIRTNTLIDIKETDQIVYIGDIEFSFNKKYNYDMTVTDGSSGIQPLLKEWTQKKIPIQKRLVDRNAPVETFFGMLVSN